MEFTERTKDGVTYEQVSELGVPHGFSTRIGGVSEGIYASLNLGMHRGDDPECVAENYRRFCAAVGVERGSMVFTNQVHSAIVRTCTSADRGYGPDRPIDYEADGLVTDVPGLVLTIFAADCLPVLLYDPVRQVIAAVHAGWRGTAGDIVGNAVARMRTAYGCRHQDIRAAIGPCISRCCFETDADVPDALADGLGVGAIRDVEVRGDGKFNVDLKGINAHTLLRMGVLPQNIAISPDCTACQPEKYWSHRVTGARRGSMAAVIALPMH